MDAIFGGLITTSQNIERGCIGWDYEVAKLRALISQYGTHDELVCVVRSTNARILDGMFVDMIGHGCKKLIDKDDFLLDDELDHQYVDLARNVIEDSVVTRKYYEGTCYGLPININVSMKRETFKEEDVDQRLILYVRPSDIVLAGGQPIYRYIKRVVPSK